MFEITNKTKAKLPGLPFGEIKESVLGKKYDLSLVFIGNTSSRRLNKEMKGINKPTDILSFPLCDDSGEIFINLRLAEAQAHKYEREKTNFIAFLFIHGLMHLKGYSHGSTMESKEVAIRKRFNI